MNILELLGLMAATFAAWTFILYDYAWKQGYRDAKSDIFRDSEDLQP